MGLFLLQNFQKNLFPYQKSLDEMGRRLGVGSRMPGWARKTAMSGFQPVPAPEEKKKKKDKSEKQKNKKDDKKGGKKDREKDGDGKQGGESGKHPAERPVEEKKRAKASESRAVPEAGRHAAKRMDGAGTPETADHALGPAVNSADGQAGQAEYTEVPGQPDGIPEKESDRQNRPGGAMSPEALRSAVAWSVILGEPVARKRQRMRRGRAPYTASGGAGRPKTAADRTGK